MAFVEAELGESCLLSAMLAINLHPGETVQPWHFDDSGARVPRPRPALGVSTFWAIDDTTEQNGATEIIPGSHLWDGQYIEGAVKPSHFTNEAEHDEGNGTDAIKLTMPSGSLAMALSCNVTPDGESAYTVVTAPPNGSGMKTAGG